MHHNHSPHIVHKILIFLWRFTFTIQIVFLKMTPCIFRASGYVNPNKTIFLPIHRNESNL